MCLCILASCVNFLACDEIFLFFINNKERPDNQETCN